MSLRDAICAAARGGIYIISQPRFIEAISQPNASEVISHLPQGKYFADIVSSEFAICLTAREGIYFTNHDFKEIKLCRKANHKHNLK